MGRGKKPPYHVIVFAETGDLGLSPAIKTWLEDTKFPYSTIVSLYSKSIEIRFEDQVSLTLFKMAFGL